MKNQQPILVCFLALVTITLSCKKETNQYIAKTTYIQSCNLTSAEFNTWFSSGTASENGSVMNANSVKFAHNNNCDFYKWSEQMFLWITTSKDNETVMESPVFYTISPKKITAAGTIREFIPHVKGTLLRAVANVDKTGKINTEEGQATDDVLMDRYGNLVYYISFGNDVYAQFLTAVKNSKMSGNTFPTTAQERDSIVNFASEHDIVLKDPNALAIELKTSWIIADSLKNADEFITVDAIIPTYNKTDSLWVISGEKPAKLAMVGMHIVGSASDHPEMIWATFEHKNNTPNTAYQYFNKKGDTITVPADGDGDWIFNSNVKDSANVSHMTFSGDSIKANKEFTISPSNTILVKPWGSRYDTQPNAEDSSPAASNTTVININNSIATLLPGNDIRKNYKFIGATWTDSGTAPNGRTYSPTDTVKGVAIGTSQLANSTMETYFQNGKPYKDFSSCFTCHNNNSGLKPIDLSHVFNDIVPIPSE